MTDLFPVAILVVSGDFLGVLFGVMRGDMYRHRRDRVAEVFSHILRWDPPYHVERPSRATLVSSVWCASAPTCDSRGEARKLADKNLHAWLSQLLCNTLDPLILDDAGYSWERLESELVTLSADDAYFVASATMGRHLASRSDRVTR